MFHVSLSWTHEDCFNVILGVTFFHQSRKSRVRCLACCFPPPRYWKVTRLSELVLQWWFKYLEDSPWSSISFWYWQPLGRTHFVGKTRKCGTTFFFSLFLIFNFFFDVSTTRCMSLRKRLLKKAFFFFPEVWKYLLSSILIRYCCSEHQKPTGDLGGLLKRTWISLICPCYLPVLGACVILLFSKLGYINCICWP